MRTAQENKIIGAGPIAVLAYLFAFVWLGVYIVGLANQVSEGNLGFGALGEMIPLLAGLPILLISITKKINLLALGAGVGALLGLVIDAAILQNPTISGGLLGNLQTLSTQGASLVYQTSKQSLVVTIGSYSVAEEGGFGMLSRTLLDTLFGINPTTPRYWLVGIPVSIINGLFFDIWHIFVTVPLYGQLLNAPPVLGIFNIAILLSPFSLSAIVARVILDTSNRISKDYTASIIGHAGFDMIITARALGLGL